eukprot:SAG22_NODE_20546_length_264_cov_72.036364_1_plen_43_part_10
MSYVKNTLYHLRSGADRRAGGTGQGRRAGGRLLDTFWASSDDE